MMRLTIDKIDEQIIAFCLLNHVDPRIECDNTYISEDQIRQLTDAMVLPALSSWLKANEHTVWFSSRSDEHRELVKTRIQELEDDVLLESAWESIFSIFVKTTKHVSLFFITHLTEALCRCSLYIQIMVRQTHTEECI